VPWPLQSCNAALPAMKLSGKETDALMQMVAEWWSDELSQPKSWAAVELTGGQRLLALHLSTNQLVTIMRYVQC
jgi:hypothetical protein